LPPDLKDKQLLEGSNPLETPFSVESRIKGAVNTIRRSLSEDEKELFNICKDNTKQLLTVAIRDDLFIGKHLKTWSSNENKNIIYQLMGKAELRGAKVEDLLDATHATNGNINAAIEKVKEYMAERERIRQSNSGQSRGWFSSSSGSTGSGSTGSRFLSNLGSPGTFSWY
jgi:hypothetical protein